MKLLLKSIAALLLLGAAVWAIRSDLDASRGVVDRAHAAAEGGDPSWRQAPLWDDGKAEYCAYKVTWARYGHHHPGRALLILVKEPWAPDLDVKADEPRKDGFDVLKLNHLRDVPTGIYTYHQMASVFLRRDSGTVQKIAASSAEACGISTADMVRGKLSTRSYFDGQGDRVQAWQAGVLPEDGLPALLRDYVAGDTPATLKVFPSLLMGRYADLSHQIYRVEKTIEGSVEFRLTSGKSVLTYTFETVVPYRLLRFARGDGTVYEMVKCERIPYWQMHDPGDEAWLPEEVR
jgi:hypothetical protein